MVSNRNKLTIGMKSARKKFAAGDFEGAIASYTEAINRRLADKRILDLVDKNRLAEAYNDRGLAKSEIGRDEEALADLDEAIRLDPEFAAAWNNRGSAKSEIGRHEEALADLDNAIRLDSTKATAWYNRGSAKNALGRYEEALEDLDNAIRLDPELAVAWSNRGLAKSEIGRDEEALADLDEAIRLDLELAAAWNNRGSAKNRLGRYEEALADLDEAIRLDPELAVAWDNRGSVKADIQRFDDAIKDVEKAVSLSSEDPEIRNNLAAIKAEQSAHEAVEKRLGSLADTRELEAQAEKYEGIERTNRDRAYGIMVVLLVFILVIVGFFAELESIDLAEPFSLLPLISITIIITSPLVWAIRLLLTEANKAELMKAEYEHLFIVERRIFVYFAKDDTNEGKKIRADYIKTTMTNSPADKLLTLQNKTSVPSPNPVQNVIEKGVSKVSDKSSS